MDKSKGRFLALYKGFLDVAIYRRGREVTIGGKITGKRVPILTYGIHGGERTHMSDYTND